MKLCQVVALVKGKKSEDEKAKTKAYHMFQKPDRFAGNVKTYEPKDEDGERYPGDEKRLQLRVEELLQEVAKVQIGLFNMVEMQDECNCKTRADVVVDDGVLFENVPPTYLMFLEHKLTDLITLLSEIPVLDATKDWRYSKETRCYRTPVAIRRTKTKKVARFTTVAEADEYHPAQVIQTTEDTVEGFWDTIEFSGAVGEKRKYQLIERARKMKDAVIVAREKANGVEVDLVPSIGKSVFDYLLKEED
jgi:hypothetical protein